MVAELSGRMEKEYWGLYVGGIGTRRQSAFVRRPLART